MAQNINTYAEWYALTPWERAIIVAVYLEEKAMDNHVQEAMIEKAKKDNDNHAPKPRRGRW